MTLPQPETTPSPTPLDALLGQIDGALARGDGPAAVALADAGLADAPRSVPLRRKHAQALRLCGRHDAALAAFQALGPDAGTLVEIGRTHLALGDPKSAAPAFARATTLAPRFLPGWRGHIRSLRLQHDWTGALDVARAALDHHAGSEPIRIDLAEILTTLDRPTEVIAICAPAAATSVPLSFLMAKACARLGDRVQADAVFRRILTDQPDHADARRAVVAGLEASGDTAGALAMCWHGVKGPVPPLPSGCPVILPNKALTLLVTVGDTETASDLLRQLDDQLDGFGPDQLVDLARMAEFLTQHRVAARAYGVIGQHRSISPRAALALAARAQATGDTALIGRLQAAAEALVPPAQRDLFRVMAVQMTQGPEAAVSLSRQRPKTAAPARVRTPAEALLRAQLLLATGRAPLAKRYLRHARPMWPAHPRMADLFIRACLRAGAVDTAREAIGRLAETSPMPVTRARQFDLCNATGDRAGLYALIEDAMQGHGFDLPLLDSLLVVMFCGDLDRAQVLATRFRRQPRVNVAAGRQFNTTLPGALLNELRLYTAATGSAGASADPDTIGAYVPAASHALDRWTQRLSARPSRPTTVPAAMIQYWDKPTPPTEVRTLMADWAAAADDERGSYKRFDKASARAWLSQHLGADHVRAFSRAHHVAEASDFLRLCVLLVEGGVYMDADNKRLRSLAGLLAEAGDLLVFRDVFGAIQNDVIAAAPGHPVMARAVDETCAALLNRDRDIPWVKTGPGLMTRVIARYLHDTPGTTADHLRILPLHALRRHVHPCMQLPYKATPRYWNDQTGLVPDPVHRALIRAAEVMETA
jgi:tetratricopeptide (TPR) repeat protein